ncbi:hypothetical protein [Nocardiopsis ansamitocini]|uniref:Uncharacterized protein n=1 Tax=Nocardiopsis ansamitocini TaxID=1670832 RepID=A0A9W6P5Q4_9ACTN|nr:hypothetical protein [Nocardiopsis ansamitocini]GLU47483.1 hypothetical protein Nans01_18340 [Nocardiopsis ansamitocini]
MDTPQPRQSPFRTVAAVLLTLSAAAVAAGAGLVGVRSYTPSPLARTDAETVADALPRLAFVGDALREGAGEDMQGLFPEGYFFSHALYGLTWLDVADRETAHRSEALAEARWALERLDSPAGTAPFPAEGSPAHGVFHSGWSNWLRGRIVSVAGGPESAEAEMDTLNTATAELSAAFDSSIGRGTPFLDAYPGQAWPVDSVVAVAALRLRDDLAGDGRNTELVERWITAASALPDPATGLLPHRVDSGDGSTVQGARASSQSLLLRFLYEIDPEWAAVDYAVFRELFSSPHLMLPGVREYPRGDDSPGDVDSGPLLFGLSASASTVALAGAVLLRDEPAASALTGFAEASGAAVEFNGKRRYLGGTLPVGDAFLMWSLATVPALSGQVEPVATHQVGPWWRVPWHLATLIPSAALVWAALRAWRPTPRGAVERFCTDHRPA